MTQCGVTHPLKPCLIGICKDMMSKMDPMRALGLQDEVAGTSLVTRKFSSSIFCWKGLHKFQEVENKNTKHKPWLQNAAAYSKGHSPAFYSHKGSYWRATRDTTVAALTDAIMHILHTVQSHVSTQYEDIHLGFYFWGYFGCNQCGISDRIIFLGFFTRKGVFSDIGSD